MNNYVRCCLLDRIQAEKDAVQQLAATLFYNNLETFLTDVLLFQRPDVPTFFADLAATSDTPQALLPALRSQLRCINDSMQMYYSSPGA